jgi:hypothetical protein
MPGREGMNFFRICDEVLPFHINSGQFLTYNNLVNTSRSAMNFHGEQELTYS